MEFLGFGEETASFLCKHWFGGCDHSKKIFGFLCFFCAPTNEVAEVFSGDALIRFTVVRSYTGATAHKLVNESIIRRIPGYLL